MLTVEKIAESLRNIDKGAKATLVKEIIELAGQLDTYEIIKEDAIATRLDRKGLLVATNRRLIFLSSGVENERGFLIEEFSYEEIINIKTVPEYESSSLTIWLRELSYSFKDINNENAEQLSRYICSRSFCDKKPIMVATAMQSVSPKLTKATGSSVRGSSSPLSTSVGNGSDLLEEQTAWWQIKNSLHIIFALIPFFLTFLCFLIMGYRTKSKKYYIFSGLYFIPIFFLYKTGMDRWSIGLTIFSWFIGVIHSLLARREYLLYLVVDENQWRLGESQISEQQPLEGILAEETTVLLVEDEFTANLFIKKMQQLNIAIEDQVISDYLDEMEKICTEIFRYVEKYPEEKSQIQYLVTYYLPETFKLLENYDELSHKAVKTEAITQAMQEISESLATILEAFINLYNSLYQDKALHISTDIKVLKDILAQHGLTNNSSEFDLKK